MAKRKNRNSKYFNVKHYLYTLLIIIGVILAIWYVYSWYKVKNEEKLLTSYLISTNTLTYEIDDLSEIVEALRESPSDYFIYVSYTKDYNVYKLEKKLKKIIDDYDLADAFYYINVTKELENKKGVITTLNSTFNTDKVINIPCILYFKNNELNTVIINKDGLFDYNDLINLLKNNEYEKAS